MYEHANFKLEDKGDKRALVRCPECHKENYALSVLSGICAWCGFNINEKKDDNQ
jgi:ribosomal protein L37E